MQALVIIEAPGKIRSWSRALAGTGLDARILATVGHVCDWPDTLFPLGFEVRGGRVIETLRLPRRDAEIRIRKAFRELAPGGLVLLATDDDIEGDVIAHDVAEILLALEPGVASRLHRLRPGALDTASIRRALEAARQAPVSRKELFRRAVPGRSRALSDRWIGATFSRMAEASCGRVRAALLGSMAAWRAAPDRVRSPPETGEITLEARSGSGGLPFLARIPLQGCPDPVLVSLVQRYSGRMLPGRVAPPGAAGAAVAPRFGLVGPFNTGDAIVQAMRFHGLDAASAMRGLQDSYMAGRISYPRTDARGLSDVAAARVLQAAQACGLRMPVEPGAPPFEGAHDGLHPTPEPSMAEISRLKAVLRRPFRDVDPDNRNEVEDLMTALVARRAFEAVRGGALDWGVFRPDPGADLSAAEIALLRDVDWMREQGPAMPWFRGRSTALRSWPLESILVDGLMGEDLGRPSTWAGHAGRAVSAGQVDMPSPFDLPRPSPEGVRVLRSIPAGLRNPALCRKVETACLRPAEDGEEEMGAAIGLRVALWFRGMPPDIRQPMVEALQGQAGGSRRAPHTEVRIPDEVEPPSTSF